MTANGWGPADGAGAKIGPGRTGADLRVALEGIEPPDDQFVADIEAVRALLVVSVSDPWSDS